MFVRTVRDHGGLTPPKACATINGFVVYSLFFILLYKEQVIHFKNICDHIFIRLYR